MHGELEYFSRVYELDGFPVGSVEDPRNEPVPARVRVRLAPSCVSQMSALEGPWAAVNHGTIRIEPADCTYPVFLIIEIDKDFVFSKDLKEAEREGFEVLRFLKEERLAPKIHEVLFLSDWTMGGSLLDEEAPHEVFAYQIRHPENESAFLDAGDCNLHDLLWLEEQVVPAVCNWLTEQYKKIWTLRRGAAAPSA